MAENSQLVEKYVEGEWEVTPVKDIKAGDTFRAYTPDDTSDDRTWFLAEKDAELVDGTWTVDSEPLDRSETEEDGGDLPTEEA